MSLAPRPRPRASNLTGVERAKVASSLREEYEAGSSIRVLAARNQRSYGATHRLLVESGAVFRSRGGQKRTT
ncbi:helix-turn-helix domain-containing protein [Streptomyces sp. NPDC004787]|uniref:helix-turn-helix domain-containing protein n=1 Tax=Streptomyces sp. NPDC004787 TaxID=3154291 RepID=UPI0033A424D6